MQINFPVEFLVHGTPVSIQARRSSVKQEWKDRVRTASSAAIPSQPSASEERMSITLYYLPNELAQGDVDNIPKLVIDALKQYIYVDDAQVERVVVQKFEPGNVFSFASPSGKMVQAIMGSKPVLYIRVSNDPFEDLK